MDEQWCGRDPPPLPLRANVVTSRHQDATQVRTRGGGASEEENGMRSEWRSGGGENKERGGGCVQASE